MAGDVVAGFDWEREAYVAYPTPTVGRWGIIAIPTLYWGLATLIIEILSFVPSLAPSDPWPWRLGLGIPATFVFGWFLWAWRERLTISERVLQWGLMTIWILAAAVNFTVMMITPATYAVLLDLIQCALASGMYFRPRVVIGQMLVLAMISTSPLFLGAPGHHPGLAAWLLVYLPSIWLVVAVTAYVRVRINTAVGAADVAARTDPLTGLANLNELRRAIDGRALRHTGGLLMIDLDNFKAANTLYGHPGGDHALRTVAKVLHEAASPGQLVARIGGDELAVFVADIAESEPLAMLGEYFRTTVREANSQLGLDGVQLDASIGCAIYPRDGRTLDELLIVADLGMYTQKALHHATRRMPEPAITPSAFAAPQSEHIESIGERASLAFSALSVAALAVGASCAMLLAIALPSTPGNRAAGLAIATSLLVLGAMIAVFKPNVRILSHPVLDFLVAAAIIVEVRLSGGFASSAMPLVFPQIVMLVGATWERSVKRLIIDLPVLSGASLARLRLLDAYRVARRLVGPLVRVTLVPTAVVLSPLAYTSWRSVAMPATTIAFALTITIVCQAVAAALLGWQLALACLEQRAHIDPLTRLANRRAFLTHLQRRVERAHRPGSNRSVAVVVIDLDNFGEVNNKLGHAAGDVLLAGIADALRNVCRQQDFLARIGGDEFAAVLSGVDANSAADLARRYIHAVRARAAASGDGVSAAVSASAGFALSDAHDQSIDDLVARADDALMRVKQTGKGRALETVCLTSTVSERVPSALTAV